MSKRRYLLGASLPGSCIGRFFAKNGLFLPLCTNIFCFQNQLTLNKKTRWCKKKLQFRKKVCTFAKTIVMTNFRILFLLVLFFPHTILWGQTECHLHIESGFEANCYMPAEGQNSIDQTPGMTIACKGSTVCYTAVGECENDIYSNGTYEWAVQGAMSYDTAGNRVYVTWGNGASGIVRMKYADGCSCDCNIMLEITLIDQPVACSHTIPAYRTDSSGNKIVTVCRGGSVAFMDCSDGNGGEITGNTWSGILFSSSATNCILDDIQGNTEISHSVVNSCGCTDEESYIIEVLDGESLELSCYGTVCEGDVVNYKVLNPPCDMYAWQVSGGHVISGRGESQITVVWDEPHDGYGELSVDGSLCGGNVCGLMIGKKIPVVHGGVRIKGRTMVCEGDAAIYSVPLWGSVEYHWHISPESDSNDFYLLNNANRVEYIFQESGRYKIYVTYGSGFLDCGEFCSDTLEVVVRPKLSIVGEKKICLSNPCNLSVPTGESVCWRIYNDGDSLMVDTVGVSLEYRLPFAGAYRVVAFSSLYCDTAWMMLVVEPAPDRPTEVGNPVLVCRNTSALFRGMADSPRYSLQWYPADTTCAQPSKVTGDNVTIDFFANRVCNVDVYQYDRELQCRSDSARHISVNFLEIHPIQTPRHLYVCPNTLFELEVPEQKDVLYRWKIQTDAQRYVSLQGDAMSYAEQVVVNDFAETDSADCYITLERFCCANAYRIDTFYLHIRRKHVDTLGIVHSHDMVCMNDTVSFNANNTTNWRSFYWKADDDIVGYFGKTYVHAFNTSGIHFVQLRYSPFDYCTNDSYYSVTVDSITIIPAPDLERLEYDTTRNRVLLYPRLSTLSYSFDWCFNNICDTTCHGNYMGWQGYGNYKCMVTSRHTGCRSGISRHFMPPNPPGCSQLTNVPWVSQSSFDTCSGKIMLVHDTAQLGINPDWVDGGDDYSYTHRGDTTVVSFHKAGNYRIKASKNCKASVFEVKVAFVPYFSAVQICDEIVITNQSSAYNGIDSVVISVGDTQFVFDNEVHEVRFSPAVAGDYEFSLASVYRQPSAENVVACDTFSCVFSPRPQESVVLSIGNIFDTNLACDNTPMLLTASLPSGTKIASTEWHFGDGSFYKGDSNTIYHTYESDFILLQDVEYSLNVMCYDSNDCVYNSNYFNILTSVHLFENPPPPSSGKISLIHEMDTLCSYDDFDTLKVQWMDYVPTRAKYYWNSRYAYDSLDYYLTNHSATYTVRAVNQYMCQEQASAFVPFKNSPNVKITSEKTEYCEGEEVTLYGALDDDSSYQYLWTIIYYGINNDTIYDTTATVAFVPDSAGLYQICLCITNTEGCRRCQNGYWISVNPIPDMPSIAFGDIHCIDSPPVKLVNNGNSRPLHWSNGNVGAMALYYAAGTASAYYYDSLTGCKSNDASLYIPAAPDFDAIPTGCYQMCRDDLPFDIRCYGLTQAMQQIDWWWECDSETQNDNGDGSEIGLHVEQFSKYLLNVKYAADCMVESSPMVVEESHECECRGLQMEYDYVYSEGECEDGYKVHVKLCNYSERDYCIGSITPWDDDIVFDMSLSLPTTIRHDSCIEMEINIAVPPSPEVLLPIRVISERCYECYKDYVLHLVPRHSCVLDFDINIGLNDIWGYSMAQFSFTADFHGTHIDGGGGNQPSIFHDVRNYLPSAVLFTTPSSILHYSYESGYVIDGGATFDISALAHLAEVDSEVCFYVYICVEGNICVAKYCIDANTLLDMIPPNDGIYYVKPNQYEEHNPDALIVAYPNPATDIINFKGVDDRVIMEVYDIYGRIVIRQTDNKLNLIHLPCGIYILKIIQDKSESQYIKVIKK